HFINPEIVTFPKLHKELNLVISLLYVCNCRFPVKHINKSHEVFIGGSKNQVAIHTWNSHNFTFTKVCFHSGLGKLIIPISVSKIQPVTLCVIFTHENFGYFTLNLRRKLTLKRDYFIYHVAICKRIKWYRESTSVFNFCRHKSSHSGKCFHNTVHAFPKGA